MKKDENLLLYIGGGALLYFGLLRPILNKLGITKSENDRIVDLVQSLPNDRNPFSAKYYKLIKPGTKILLLTNTAADMLAKKLYDALGVISDDESAVFGVFRQLKTKTQVSFLADKFYNKYKLDLFEFLKRGKNQFNPASGLNSDELKVIIDIVNGLPPYKI